MKFIRKIKLPKLHFEFLQKIKLPRIQFNALRKLKLPKVQIRPFWLFIIAGGLIVINLVFLILINLPDAEPQKEIPQSTISSVLPPTATLPPTPIPPEPTQSSTEVPVAIIPSGSSLSQGTILFSMVKDGYSNIYSFQPGLPGFLRLTAHPWDDIQPSLSPDGSKLAYTSKQNGYWNIYIMDMASGQVIPVTDSAEFDGHPVWSPDGTQILIESYLENYFQLQIVDLSAEFAVTKQITFGSYSNYDATWSPDGKTIAYVSNISGDPALWMINITDDQRQYNSLPISDMDTPAHPTFSPDGTKLAFSSILDGNRTIFTWDPSRPDLNPRMIGQGDQLAWSPDSQVIFCSLTQPLRTYFTAYTLQFGNIAMPPFVLSGDVAGIDWKQSPPNWLQNPWVQAKQQVVDEPLYRVQLTPVAESGRFNLVQIPGINLQYPFLQDMVDEAFQTFRNRMVRETGWDVLANIQSAFLPLSQTSEPDKSQDWLYTGRAFAINTVPMNVGWMVLVKEGFGNQTYWRIYIRPLFQDGSMGSPIHYRAWDMNSRFSNDTAAYEQGGKTSESDISGYWVDFTDFARRYGWDRLSALSNWLTFYPAARFNLFINNGGLSWKAAMLELYPQEIFITPTLVELPTATPTNTPKPRKPVTPTHTPVPTSTTTLRPTWTPLP
jgi:TolB protein